MISSLVHTTRILKNFTKLVHSQKIGKPTKVIYVIIFFFFLLLDFSDSSFVSDPADGKNCMTSHCTSVDHVNFVKLYCNSTDNSLRGFCGKLDFFIDCIHNENNVPSIVFFIRRFHKLF